MAEYLISFRVSELDTFATSGERRNSIYETISELTSVWEETTSFIVLRADNTTFDILRIMTAGLDERIDQMLIRRVGFKDTVFWGAIKHDALLIDLIPDARRIRF